MAECDTCHNWYHRNCENIPPDVFDKFKDRWNGTVQIVKKYALTDDMISELYWQQNFKNFILYYFILKFSKILNNPA